MTSRAFLAILSLGACSVMAGCTPASTTPQCQGGTVPVGQECRALCTGHSNCATAEFCNGSGICEVGTRPTECLIDGDCVSGFYCSGGSCLQIPLEPPLIQSVYGDGAAGIVDTSIYVQGQRLAAATVGLDDGAGIVALTDCGDSTATLLHVNLPPDVLPGNYTLHVTNQGGSCAQPVQLLQGSPDTGPEIIQKVNDAIAADPTLTLSGVLPPSITFLAVQAEGGGVSRSVMLGDTELVDQAQTNNGLFVSVINRTTHAADPGPIGTALMNWNYTATQTDINNLTTLLTGLSGDVIVVLASRGNITAMAADAPLAAAMQRAGASAALATLSAASSYVLIGIPGIGTGAGVELSSNTGVPVAVSTVLQGASALGLRGAIGP